MPLRLLLDSSILICAIRPEVGENKPVAETILHLLEDPYLDICVPEIVDYELRRKLLHMGHYQRQARRWAREALVLLDKFGSTGFLPLTAGTLKMAAALWAQTRSQGQLRGPEESLDVDVILAAQARQTGGQVVTMNDKHFTGLVGVFDWRAYQET